LQDNKLPSYPAQHAYNIVKNPLGTQQILHLHF